MLKHRCFSKDWDVTEYGVSELTDIISEIPDTTICLSQQDDDMVICIRKRGMWRDVVYLSSAFVFIVLLRPNFTV